MMLDWKHQDQQAEDETADRYDYLYYRTRFAKSMFNDFANVVKQKINELHAKDICELGCGTGLVSALLPINNFWVTNPRIHCVDFSSNMLTIAKSRCEEVLQADIDQLPYTDSTMDIVYAHSVLHHFQDLSLIMSEVKRILKPNGYFIIQEPNQHHITADKTILGLCKLAGKKYEDVSSLEVKPSEHHAPISIAKLGNALKDFTIETLEYRYYVSYLTSMYDSAMLHRMARSLDSKYVKQNNDGYMILAVARKR